MTPDSVPPAVIPRWHVLPNGRRLGFIQLPAGSQAACTWGNMGGGQAITFLAFGKGYIEDSYSTSIKKHCNIIKTCRFKETYP